MASHIGRRKFLAALGGTATAWPLAARAQQAGKVYRIGFFSAGEPIQSKKIFVNGLRELGWIEGKNILFEGRFAENRLERLPGLAAELV